MYAAHSHQEFLDWYQPLHEQFVRYCSSRSYGVIETEDLVQEVILAALEGFAKVRDKERLLGYMIGVANNMIRNKKRRLKFRGDWDQQAFEKLESQQLDPEVALDIHYLLKAIEQLPEKQKEALLLFEVSGFSIREISQIQGASEAAIKTRLSRCRKKLKTLLAEDQRPMSMAQRLAIFSSLLF
ncbi:MAG: RNA polymerase sigma factor [Bacteroidota bacterium]